jgi:hypothetical protein
VQIREVAVESMATLPDADLRSVDSNATGDTGYGIDRITEATLLRLLGEYLSDWLPATVVAEGLPNIGFGPGIAVVPSAAAMADSKLWVIVDPIDGTRGLMYGKRSAWILTGVAILPVGRGIPRATDIDVAVQTEVPPPKQTLADTLWAIRGSGPNAIRTDLRTHESWSLKLGPSSATSLEHGFGQVARVFPGCRDVLAAIDDEVCLTTTGPGSQGRGLTFEDQYISTGGQLGELMYGHDRWIADLRPLLSPLLKSRGLPAPQCCHPYDICTALIAQECGVLISGLDGPLDHQLVLGPNVTWAGYANESIRALVEPALKSAIVRLLPGRP